MKNVIEMALTPNEMNNVLGTCHDCGKACYGRDDYIVKPAVWSAARLSGWRSGFLHLKCLEKRLGRRVKKKEFLLWQESGVARVHESDADEMAILWAKNGHTEAANALMIAKRMIQSAASAAKVRSKKGRTGG